MGNEKTVTSTNTQYTMSPEERANYALDMQRKKANLPSQMALDQQLYGFASDYLKGKPLTGNLALAGGVSDQQSQRMATQGVNSLYPQFQSSGIMDSGVAAAIAGRSYADILNNNAQFNVSAQQQILNQAMGGSSMLTSATQAQNSMLASQLAGLRSVNTTSTVSSMNPFLKSFQTSMGSTVGKATGTALTGMIF